MSSRIIKKMTTRNKVFQVPLALSRIVACERKDILHLSGTPEVFIK